LKPLRLVCICLLLLACTLAIYGKVHGFAFVNYDDPDYVTANPNVLNGLSITGLAWALKSDYAGNWFPLTWLSHMLDCQLFGADSGAHHLTNLALHCLSTIALFLLLARLTKTTWRSAGVAFLFALHPLHVESVAWISERKDVLSGLFWILSIWTYVLYVEKRTAARYTLALATFLVGLAAKSMLVSLPLIFLLLDVWPLRRVREGPRILTEKVPFVLLSLTVSIVTFNAQRHGGAVSTIGTTPIGARLANALISYAVYLRDFVWPGSLAVFYPYPAGTNLPGLIAAAALLPGISFLAWRNIGRRPYLFAGWSWYLITLLPVIGLIQVGAQSRADRYTYIPMIGISIAVSWGLAEFISAYPRVKWPVIGLCTMLCTFYAIRTYSQLDYWRNSESLFRHAISVTAGNYVADNGLGLALREEGRLDEAIDNYRYAVKAAPEFALHLNPSLPEAHVNLAAALKDSGQAAQAAVQYREAIRLQPDNVVAHCGLGAALLEQGEATAALREYQEAARLRPDDPDTNYGMGLTFAVMGRRSEAIEKFAEVLKLRPNDADAHYNLGTALGAGGKLTEAIDEFNETLRLKPGYANARLNLGKALANLGRIDESVTQLREALKLDPKSEDIQQTLRKALEIQRKLGNR
jgi:tetratricopeptide (TPR) repeat protein